MVGFKVRRIIYTDVRGVKTRLCGAAQQPRQGCAVRQVTTTMWEWVCGSELTRRGGGDHEQRQKRVWGAKHFEAPIAPKLHKRLDRRRTVRSEYIEGKERGGGVFTLPKASVDLVRLIGVSTHQLGL